MGGRPVGSTSEANKDLEHRKVGATTLITQQVKEGDGTPCYGPQQLELECGGGLRRDIYARPPQALRLQGGRAPGVSPAKGGWRRGKAAPSRCRLEHPLDQRLRVQVPVDAM